MIKLFIFITLLMCISSSIAKNLPTTQANGSNCSISDKQQDIFITGLHGKVVDVKNFDECVQKCMSAGVTDSHGFKCSSGVFYEMEEDVGKNCVLNIETRNSRKEDDFRNDAGLIYFEVSC